MLKLIGGLIVSFWDIFQIKKIKEENTRLNIRVSYLENQLSDLGFTEYEQTKKEIESLNNDIAEANITINKLRSQIEVLNEDSDKAEKKLNTAVKKLNKSTNYLQNMIHVIQQKLIKRFINLW